MSGENEMNSHSFIWRVLITIGVLVFLGINFRDDFSGDKKQNVSPFPSKSMSGGFSQKNQTQAIQGESRREVQMTPGDLATYFPIRVGQIWTYDVVIPDTKQGAHFYRSVQYVHPDSGDRVQTHGRGVYATDTSRVAVITLEVAEQTRGSSNDASDGVFRIRIVRDDKDMFGSPEEFHMIFSNSNEFGMMVWWHFKFGPSMLTEEYRSKYTQLGLGGRVVFFTGSVGNPIVSESAHERAYFLQEFDYKGRPSVVFVREVEERKQGADTSGTKQKFSEQYTYVQHVGLVSMIQTIDGVVTMYWTLRE